MTNTYILRRLSLLAFTVLLVHGAEGGAAPARLEIDGGNITFDAATNFSAVSVHGKSTALKGVVRLQRDAKQLLVNEWNATVPAESLSTGMGLRDDHMKKYIFTAADGRIPELKFTGTNMACPLEAGKETGCSLSGKLTVRGVERPMSIALKLRPDAAGSTRSYRAIADGVVKLSDYGIERPSQLGVKCADEVKIHIEFQAKEVTERSAYQEGRR